MRSKIKLHKSRLRDYIRAADDIDDLMEIAWEESGHESSSSAHRYRWIARVLGEALLECRNGLEALEKNNV